MGCMEKNLLKNFKIHSKTVICLLRLNEGQFASSSIDTPFKVWDILLILFKNK